MSSPPRVTELLLAWGGGDQGAFDNLLPLIYGELRRLAAHYLRGERPNHTLQPTALVHEAYLRLVGQTGTSKNAPQRFETTVKFRPNESHQLRVTTSAARLGKIENTDEQLGQISFQALDEWKVREGVVLVLPPR